MVAAHVVAAHTKSAHPAASANSAYVHGMAAVLIVCGIASLVAALLAALLLPNAPVVRKTGGKEAPAMAAPVADAGQ